MCKTKVTKTKKLVIFRLQGFFSSNTDAAAGAAAIAAASAAAVVFTTVFTVVATMAAAEAAAVAAAPAAASVSEEKNSWTLNIIRFLVFVTLFLHRGVTSPFAMQAWREARSAAAAAVSVFEGKKIEP